MSCGVGCRHDSDPVLLGLWHRSTAGALIRPLAWEFPCAAGAALNKKKKKKKKLTIKYMLGTDIKDLPALTHLNLPIIL